MSKKAVVALKIGSIYLIANIFEKAIEFFLLPVFTNLLSTSDYGIVSTYLSYVNIISIFVSLSLGNSIRSAIIDYKEELDAYVSSIVTLQSIIAMFVSLCVIIVSRYCLPDKYSILVVFCLIHSFFSCIIGMVSLRYMLETKYIKRSLLSIIPNLIAIPISIVLIKCYPDAPYMGRILGVFATAAIVGAAYTVIVIVRGKCYINKVYWKYALRFSLPLVFHGLSLVLLNQMDRTMLTSMRDASETGIYSVACSFGTIAIAFTGAIENTWIPWFYKKMDDSDYASINRISILYTWTCVLLAIGVIFLSPEIIRWLINNAYWASISVVPLLVASTFFKALCGLPINAMYYTKKTKMIATSSLVAAVVNLLLNYFLIPSYGAVGAAFATLVSYNVLFAMQSISTHRNIRDIFKHKTYVPQVIMIILLIIFTYLLSELPLVRWTLAVLATVIYVVAITKGRIINFAFIKKK